MKRVWTVAELIEELKKHPLDATCLLSATSCVPPSPWTYEFRVYLTPHHTVNLEGDLT